LQIRVHKRYELTSDAKRIWMPNGKHPLEVHGGALEYALVCRTEDHLSRG